MDFDAISVRPVSECVSIEVAAALTRLFKGYLIPMGTVDAELYERRFRAENLDPFASRVYLHGEAPVRILLVARRGWTSRIAAMALRPKLAGVGWGSGSCARPSRTRSCEGITPYCWRSSSRMSPRSTSTGGSASTRRRLFSYRLERDATVPGPSGALSEMDPSELACIVMCEGDASLPWMLAAGTLSAATPPAKAYHLDHHAYALVGDPEAETLVLKALVIPRAERSRGWGTRLVNALRAEFPDRAWAIPQLVPENFDGFFTKLGWERESLNQFEMRLDLTGERRS